MTKGTYSFGKMGGKHTHSRCPRCGKASYNTRQKVCASCGYGRSAKLRKSKTKCRV